MPTESTIQTGSVLGVKLDSLLVVSGRMLDNDSHPLHHVMVTQEHLQPSLLPPRYNATIEAFLPVAIKLHNSTSIPTKLSKIYLIQRDVAPYCYFIFISALLPSLHWNCCEAISSSFFSQQLQSIYFVQVVTSCEMHHRSPLGCPLKVWI